MPEPRAINYEKILLQNLSDLYSMLFEYGAESVMPPKYVVELERKGHAINSDYAPGEYIAKAFRKKRIARSKRLTGKLEQKFGQTHTKQLFEQVSDNYIEILEGNFKDAPTVIVTEERKLQEQENVLTHYRGGKIVKADWIPYRNGDKFDFDTTFVKWVDSWFPRGFSYATEYSKFNLYCQQAEDWYQAGYDINNAFGIDEQIDFCVEEKRRYEQNSLYYVYKNGRLKDGSYDGGRRRIEPYKAQKLLLYLLDCELSAVIGKMRQLGITSIIGMGAASKTMYRREWFTKYICEDDSKTRSVFEDKIKYPISETPHYLVPSSFSDQERQLKFGLKEVKGRVDGANSKVEVVPPSATAVNSGSPQLVLIDEIGNIPILTKMVNEARPTMFIYNPETKRIEYKRQLFMWGTGGEMKTDSFETEFKAALENWKKRNFKYGIIPVFLDAFCKPGIEGEFYESEKTNAYSKIGADRDATISQFHAGYPVHIDDMFIRSVNTLVPISTCNSHLKRIWDLEDAAKPIYGRFEPVFDTNSPTTDINDWPYRVVGVIFVPMAYEDDPPIIMFHEPDKRWKHRYFQGTDPINTESGHSKFSSTIWDAEWNTISCQLFWRVRNFMECYQQSLLMGLYYDQKEWKGTPELIEYNIGGDYIGFRERKGFDKNLIYNRELNPMMHIDGSRIGISNKAATKGKIINKLKELSEMYGDNIYIQEFWEQHKTFIQKDTANGGIKWQAENLKKHYDDILFSSTFAYMASQVYQSSHRYPEFIDENRPKKVKNTFVRDANGNLRRITSLV